MLTLILAVVVVIWVIYRVKRKKSILPKKYFEYVFAKRPPDDEPPRLLFISICGLAVIITVYYGMITYIQTYDETVKNVQYYQAEIGQLEAQLDDVNTEIFNNSDFESVEELEEKRSDIKLQLRLNREKLNELSSITGTERLKIYKFLLYFGK